MGAHEERVRRSRVTHLLQAQQPNGGVPGASPVRARRDQEEEGGNMASRKATAHPRATARKTPVKKSRKAPAKAAPPSSRDATRSVKPSKAKRHYSGPEAWLLPRLEEAYSRLEPK